MRKRRAGLEKKKFFFLATAIFLSQAFADDWAFSLEGAFGFRTGVYDEIVWAKKSTDNSRYKESELNYELAPTFYTGINFSARKKRFGLNLLSKFFFPQKTGTLKDSDWRNDSVCKNGDTNTKTDYSEHSLYANNKFGGIAGFDLELQADYEFWPSRFLTLAPLFSFDAQYINFSAKDGKGWYGVYDREKNKIAPYSDESSRIVYDFTGKKVIEYEVYNLFFWTGIRADFTPFSWLKISLSSEISPLSIFLDKDRHLTNNKDFKEEAYSVFFAFRQKIKSEFIIQKNFSICQSMAFVFTGESEGTMHYKNAADDSYKKVNNNSGGGQMIVFDFELGGKISW